MPRAACDELKLIFCRRVNGHVELPMWLREQPQAIALSQRINEHRSDDDHAQQDIFNLIFQP